MEQKTTTAIGNLAELLTKDKYDLPWNEIFDKIGVKKPFEQHTSIDIKQAETETKYLKSFYNFLSTHGTHSPATNAQDAEHAFVIGPSLLRWMLRRLRKIP